MHRAVLERADQVPALVWPLVQETNMYLIALHSFSEPLHSLIRLRLSQSGEAEKCQPGFSMLTKALLAAWQQGWVMKPPHASVVHLNYRLLKHGVQALNPQKAACRRLEVGCCEAARHVSNRISAS